MGSTLSPLSEVFKDLDSQMCLRSLSTESLLRFRLLSMNTWKIKFLKLHTYSIKYHKVSNCFPKLKSGRMTRKDQMKARWKNTRRVTPWSSMPSIWELWWHHLDFDILKETPVPGWRTSTHVILSQTTYFFSRLSGACLAWEMDAEIGHRCYMNAGQKIDDLCLAF